MDDGRLVSPHLDDRTWQNLVDEVKSLIPQYAPQWTDHNPSDLGITVIELFAWLVEGMIYRLNRVPEKNYIEFLNLLGITRDPATPAKAHAIFSVTNSPSTLVPKGTKIATPFTPTEEAIVFETDEDLVALPTNLTHALYATKDNFKYTNCSEALVGGPLKPSVISIPGSSADGIFLGFSQPSTEIIRVVFDFQQAARENEVLLLWGYSRDAVEPDGWPLLGLSYTSAVNPSDETLAFTQDGGLNFSIPADWQSQSPSDWTGFIQPFTPADDVSDSLYWIVIWIANGTSAPLGLTLQQIRFNAVSASNALTVNVPRTDAAAEMLGISTGKPFQYFSLNNPPLYKRPGRQDPYDHLVVEVREPVPGGGFSPWQAWRRVKDFPPDPGPPGNQVHKCNPVTGDIFFGNQDGVTGIGNGKIPPAGSEIRALTYRYVAGGTKGNVPPKKIDVLQDPVAGVIKVVNPGPATGGSNQEAIEETKRRAPEVLRNRDRAVSLLDYEYLAREASTDITKVRALAPRLHETSVPPYTAGDPWLFGGLDRSPSRVNVIIVPDAPEPKEDPAPLPQPQPAEDLLIEVADHLQERRPAASHILAAGPRYLPIRVLASLRVWTLAIDEGLLGDPNDPNLLSNYRDSVVTQLRRFLHPTRGNTDGIGWEVGERIYVNQVFSAIQPSNEIGFIENMQLGVGSPVYAPPDRPPGYANYDQGTWILVADYELICDGVIPAEITVSPA